MQFHPFIEEVADELHTSKDEANQASRVFLETLSERLTPDEAKDLAAQLPTELKDAVHPETPKKKMNLDEFLTIMSQRLHRDKHRMSDYAQAVWNTLYQAVSRGELNNVRSQLPKHYIDFFA